jgi:hypothetical protein
MVLIYIVYVLHILIKGIHTINIDIWILLVLDTFLHMSFLATLVLDFAINIYVSVY